MTVPRFQRSIPAAFLLVVGAACHPQRELSHVVTPVLVAPSESADELDPTAAAAIAPRVARMLVLPDSITIAPGETYSYDDQLRVVVVDSMGAPLGRLRVYDVSLDPGAAQLVGAREIRGVHPGESDLWIRFPQVLWSGRGDAPRPVRLRVVVRAAG